ncbi:MAG: hypothetical protein V2A62_05110 [Candidatus Woesearchaeota archaeon]
MFSDWDKMAQKIKSWEEYEERRIRRREEIPKRLKSLETILTSSSRKKEPPSAVRVLFSSAGIIILSGLNKTSDYEDIYPQVVRETFRMYFSETIQDLTQYGAFMAKSNEGRLDEINQDQIYGEFVEELRFVNSAPEIITLEERIPLLGTSFNYFSLPRLPEQAAVLKEVVTELKNNKYLTVRSAANLVNLLFPSEKIKSPIPIKTISPSALNINSESVLFKKHPETFSLPLSLPLLEENKHYLVVCFGLSEAVAEKYHGAKTFREFESLYDNLAAIAGEEWTKLIVKYNPEILNYPQAYSDKYLDTLREVLGELRRNSVRKPNLEKKMGLNQDNLILYSDLEQLTALKQRVYQSTRCFVEGNEGKETSVEIDIEDYKDKLLGKTGLNSEVVFCLTEGKTLYFIGEQYMPYEYFRKNARNKALNGTNFEDNFKDTFDKMVLQKALVPKAKANPVYRFNPKIQEITGPYLREFMRLTLHGDKIIRQEGHLTLNPGFIKEFYG